MSVLLARVLANMWKMSRQPTGAIFVPALVSCPLSFGPIDENGPEHLTVVITLKTHLFLDLYQHTAAKHLPFSDEIIA